MSTQHYATNLTDAEWALLQPVLPAEAPLGRPRLHTRRAILNALFYVLRTGCAWRCLPQEWPAWQTVYGCTRRSVASPGTTQGLHRPC